MLHFHISTGMRGKKIKTEEKIESIADTKKYVQNLTVSIECNIPHTGPCYFFDRPLASAKIPANHSIFGEEVDNITIHECYEECARIPEDEGHELW